MATLAQINDTLRDQTSSIEDGTKTTAGLRDRFGEFLSRQQRSGDSREDEIEARQKERRKKVIAQRPQNFRAGLSQGLGFGGGLGFGAIAQKLLAGMGLAAGAIGLGAGKLISFAPAIAVMSKFGEQAIGALVDYVEKEYFDDKQLAPKTKKNLVDGVQTAIGARLLGVKSPLGLAIAGIVGAYGDTAIAAINEKFGKKDGVYNIPGTELNIDTQSETFISGLGVALSLVAPALLRFAGKRLALALALLPIGRGVKALSTAIGLALGIKSIRGGAPPPVDEMKDANAKNKKPPPPVVTRKSPVPKVNAAAAAAARMQAINSPPTTGRKVTMFGQPTVRRDAQGRFRSLNDPVGGGGKAEAIIKARKQAQVRIAAEAIKSSAALKKSATILLKAAGPLAVAFEAYQGTQDPELANMPAPVAAGTNVATGFTLGILDFVQNGYADLNNLTNQGINFLLDTAGVPEDYRLSMMSKSDTQGAANRFISRAYGNYLSNPPVIGPQPPNVGLVNSNSYNAFPGGITQFNDLSKLEQKFGGNMSIVSVGNTQDFGSAVVNMPP